MRNEEILRLDGLAFKARQLPMRKGQAVLFRLAKAFGPMMIASGMEKMQLDMDPETLNASLQGLKEEDFVFVVDAMVECSEVSMNGTTWGLLGPVYETLFIGRWADWISWLGFALRVNFASFFRGPAAPTDPVAKG